jgi:hypothetical protein
MIFLMLFMSDSRLPRWAGLAKKLDRRGQLAKADRGNRQCTPALRDRPGMHRVFTQPYADKPVQSAAKLEQGILGQRRLFADDIISEYEQSAKSIAEHPLPARQADEIVARRPVFPILLLVAGWKPPAFDVDQPRNADVGRDDEVQALDRTAGKAAALGLVDGDIRHFLGAQVGFERRFVMIVSLGHGFAPQRTRSTSISVPLCTAKAK